jgi:preprotein translocase subunit SecG
VIYLLYTIHLLVCFFLILVVLLQQGKGADLSVFGGGSTQTAFGAVGATSLLHKLTVTSFVLFILTTMTIAIMLGRGEEGVMSGYAEEQREDLTGKSVEEALAREPGAVAEEVEVDAPPAADEAPAAGDEPVEAPIQ